MESPSTPSSPQTPTNKRSKRGPSVKCPLCHDIIPPGQYRQHFQQELNQLDNPDGKTRGKRGAAIAATKQIIRGKHSTSGPDSERRTLLNEIQKRRIARNKDDRYYSSGGTGFRDGIGGGGAGRSSGGERGGGAGRRLIDELDPERSGSSGQATCFICNERLFGSLDDINAHIDRCLLHPPTSTSNNSNTNTNNTNNASSASSPVQHQQPSTITPGSRHHEPFEEYEWAGQTRIRATALFEGGLANLPGGSTSRLNTTAQTDVDDELNIEDDDEEEYGSAQFTERDVLLQNADAESEELREIVIGGSSATSPSRAPSENEEDVDDDDHHLHDHDGDEVEGDGVQASSSRQQAFMGKQKRKWKEFDDIDIDGDGEGAMEVDDDDQGAEGEEDEEIDIEDDDDDADGNDIDAILSSAFASGDTKLVIDALRGKIRHLEAVNKDVPMCLICLEPYKVPLTSIVCWHVHCEACWFRTLGTKKLCPQCQKITLPKDLRRIYL